MRVGDLLLLGAIVVFVVTGILLVAADTLEVRDGLALACFGLAAWAAAVWPGWVRA